jgi:hypothetical protein
MRRLTATLLPPALALLASAAPAQPAPEYQPSEADLRETYAFVRMSTEKFQHELAWIRVPDEKAGMDAWRRLAAEEDFAAVASAVSIDQATASKGGYLGWRFSRDFVEPFGSKVRELKPGTFSKPFKSPLGWTLVKVLHRRGYFPQPYEKLVEPMTAQLKKTMAAVEARKDDPAGLASLLAGSTYPAPVIRRFIALGTDLNNRDANGLMPLHRACVLGLVTEAGLLIQAGAQLDTPDRLGDTPLHQAAFGGDLSGTIVGMLLKAGLPAAGKLNENGEAPIHMAAALDNAEALRALVKAGESPDRPDRQGFTPLMRAAQNQAPRAVAALLALGANPLAALPDGAVKGLSAQTALDLLDLTPGDSANRHDAEAALRPATLEAAARRSQAGFRAFVVQDALRAELGKGPITLKKKPFTLEFELRGTPAVQVAALDLGRAGGDPGRLAEHVKYGMQHIGTVMAEPAEGTTLMVQTPDEPVPGSQGWSQDGNKFTVFSKTPTGFHAARRVELLDELPPGPSAAAPFGGRSVPLAPGKDPHPLLLTAAVTEKAGVFQNAVKQMAWSEVRWSDR